MKRLACWVTALILCCMPLTSAAEEPAAPPLRVDDLGWLAGCWSLNVGERTVLEQWMPPGGDALLGMSRTSGPHGMLEYEFMRIVAGDGTLVFSAMPSGQPEASFRLRSSGRRELVFENPEHDFPQRIGYKSESPDKLTAWIEGRHGERERRIDFPYRRVACE